MSWFRFLVWVIFFFTIYHYQCARSLLSWRALVIPRLRLIHFSRPTSPICSDYFVAYPKLVMWHGSTCVSNFWKIVIVVYVISRTFIAKTLHQQAARRWQVLLQPCFCIHFMLFDTSMWPTAYVRWGFHQSAVGRVPAEHFGRPCWDEGPSDGGVCIVSDNHLEHVLDKQIPGRSSECTLLEHLSTGH